MEEGGLRRRQREKLRKAILDGAVALFEDKGFDATTIAEIAEAAETSPRTVLRYFGSKEELIFERSTPMLAQLRKSLAERPTSEAPYEAMKAVMCAFAERLEGEKSYSMRRARIISASPSLLRRQAEVREEWIQGLAQEIAARVGSRAVGLEHLTVALSAFGALSVAWDYWFEPDAPPLRDLLDRAFRAIEDAVARSRPSVSDRP
jgi:AcrR family transcriptional regulator